MEGGSPVHLYCYSTGEEDEDRKKGAEGYPEEALDHAAVDCDIVATLDAPGEHGEMDADHGNVGVDVGEGLFAPSGHADPSGIQKKLPRRLPQCSYMNTGSSLACLLLCLTLVESFQSLHPPRLRAFARSSNIKDSAMSPPSSIADENEIFALLGDGKVSLSKTEERRLSTAVQNLSSQPSTSTPALLVGDWELLYTTKSDFDPASPLGKRIDGTAPGLEKIFTLFGAGDSPESGGSSSPIQRLVTGLEAVKIYQNIALSDPGGRVDQLVKDPSGNTVLRLSAAAEFDPSLNRIDFTFDLAYFVLFGGVRVPYPVPFRLLGDEARGYLDTTFVSERLRVSRGNKGTTFVLRRV